MEFLRTTLFKDLSSRPLLEEKLKINSPRRIPPRTPTLLVTYFFGGIVAALCQHGLYRYLHGKSEDKENLKTSLVLCGRALAYLSKIAFAQCILVCYKQRMWRTFRSHDLTIRALDKIFSGTEDVSLLLDWETVRSAPLITVMSLVIWLLPLATIIASPSALSFGWRPEVDDASVSVPVVNFTIESDKDWRQPVRMPDGTNKRSLMYYNTTDVLGTTVGGFDYYDQPSAEAYNLMSRNIFLSPQELLSSKFNQESARTKSCGGNYNCTYTIAFNGPGYKCEDATNVANAPFNTSILAPNGAYVYYANVDTGDYKRPQTDNVKQGPGGIPIGRLPPHLGDWRFEPELWIGFSVNTTQWLPKNSSFASNWTHEYRPEIARCIHYETEYTVNFNFTGQNCETKIESRRFIAPILGDDFSKPFAGSLPTERWISPLNDTLRYKKIAAYHALATTFRGFLRGKVEVKPPLPGPYYTMVYSDVTKTSLVMKNSEPTSDILKRLEVLYGDIVMSLLTRPDMLVTSKQEVKVHRTRYRVVFIYDPPRLWLCYGPVILLTFGILLLGVWTILEDGTTFSTGFSRILATTRNPTLDERSKGVCLGNDPFPDEFMKMKLRFGSLQYDNLSTVDTKDEGIGHCAFGLPGEVGPIHKDGVYSGLQPGMRRRL